MVQKLIAVNTPKALEFGFRTPEGNAFWPHMEKWRRHEQHLQSLKASPVKKPRIGIRGFKKALQAYEAYDMEIRKFRAILKRDYAKATLALANAYNTEDIRAEYKFEIYALAHELGMAQAEFRIFAAPPRKSRQKSFVLIPIRA
jgi:hypothetical protein